MKKLWVPLVIWMIILSCSSAINRNLNHEQLVDKIIDSANVLAESEKLEQAISYLDSSFKTVSKPGVGDIWKTYYFKYRRYYWAGRKQKDNIILQKSMRYADSMKNLILDN